MIVVLVILAILAAILVPALLGWIDKAKEKQLVVSGRTVMLAGQSAASEAYSKSGADKEITVAKINEYLAPGGNNELSTGSSWNITFDAYKVTGVQYSDGTDSVTYDASANTWTKDSSATTDASTANSAGTTTTGGAGTVGYKVS